MAVAALEKGTQAQRTVAFKSRIKDTDETEELFLDWDYAGFRPIDLKGLAWYRNAEDIFMTWAKQSVKIANRRPGKIIIAASTFSLMPW